jgi:hypothetical protein
MGVWEYGRTDQILYPHTSMLLYTHTQFVCDNFFNSSRKAAASS